MRDQNEKNILGDFTMIFPLPEISVNSYRIKKYDSFLDKAIDLHDSLGKKRHITNGPASFGEVYD